MFKSSAALGIAGAILVGGFVVSTVQSQTRTVESATVTRPSGNMSKVELLKTGKHLETVNCRDYNMLDETYRPQAIVYAANYGPKGKAHPTVTLDGVERFIPVVTANCKASPGNHFTTAVGRAMMPNR